MVAITVILAAVIGTFVLGLGDQLGDTAPRFVSTSKVTLRLLISPKLVVSRSLLTISPYPLTAIGPILPHHGVSSGNNWQTGIR